MEKSKAFDESTEKLHFLDYWQVISKRKEVIIAVFLLIVFAATIISLILPATYTGHGTIIVESSLQKGLPGTAEQIRPDIIVPEDFATHYERMKSPIVLDRVILGQANRVVYICPTHKEIELNSPTPDGRCPRGDCEQRLIKKEVPLRPDWEPLHKKWTKRDGLTDREYTLAETRLMLLKNFRIEPRRGTKLIDVLYTSRDREEAAAIANMLCEVYIRYSDEENRRMLNSALDALKSKTWDLLYGTKDATGTIIETGLIDDEQELAKLKKDSRLIVDMRTGTLIEWFDFTPLMQQQNTLRAQISSETILLSSWEGLDMEKRLTAFSKYPVILNLKQALLQQKTELSKLLNDYGEEHPVIKQMKILIADLEKNLNDEIDGIIFNQEKLIESLEEQAKSIENIINTAKDEYYDKEEKFIEYRRRSSEIARKNMIYEQISQRATIESIKDAIPTVQLQISQPATIPIYPSGPNRILNVVIGVVVGLTLGTGLAYFIEYLDTSIKTIDDLERTLGLQILGVIPQRVKLLTRENPNSPAYESYRILWTNIDFARQENRIKSLLITSAGVAEGKTTTIVNLAIAVANGGLNVLVVDSDFRRPRVHRLLEVSNQTGLTDILMRNADPDGVIARSPVPNLWVVPSGKLPPNAVGLLNSKRMKEVVDYFAGKFDIVLYDSPPVLGLSDSAVMASLVDRVLLCVEYRKYPKSIALRAKKTLENIGGKMLGGVINNINVLKEDPTYYSQVYHYFQAQEQETPQAQAPKPGRGTGRTAPTQDDDKWT